MNHPFSAVLLAGGNSSRMGRAKAFLEIEGVPLWRRQLQTLQAVTPTEIFIAGPPHSAWSDHGAIVLADAEPNLGPLGGLLAAFRNCRNNLLLVLAIDLPEMTPNFLQSLIDSGNARCGVVPTRSDRFEPLAASYPVTARAVAEEQLVARNLSLQQFVRRCLDRELVAARPVTSEEDRLFFNLNTPQDFAAHSSG
ncbi:MAG: molybdenum cofactor guanylyltransferase [Chthoniobacterales bacterium]